MSKDEQQRRDFNHIDDDFWNLYEDYLEDEDQKRVGYKEFVKQRKFTVGQTGISYRVINHWAIAGVLPEGVSFAAQDGEWRKFSFPEMVWVRIVASLRCFGISLETIKKIREQVLSWNKEKDDYSHFEFYLYLAWRSTYDPYVVVSKEGYATIACTGAIERAKTFHGKGMDLVLISLKAALNEYGRKTTAPRGLFSLSDTEVSLLGGIKHEDNSYIKAKIKDGNVEGIERTKIVINPSITDIEAEMLKNGDYGDVTFKYANGKRQSAIITKKRRK